MGLVTLVAWPGCALCFLDPGMSFPLPDRAVVGIPCLSDLNGVLLLDWVKASPIHFSLIRVASCSNPGESTALLRNLGTIN